MNEPRIGFTDSNYFNNFNCLKYQMFGFQEFEVFNDINNFKDLKDMIVRFQRFSYFLEIERRYF